MKNRKRKTTPESEIRGHLLSQKESGISIKAYCKSVNISLYCFYKWRQRYGETTSKTVSKPFMPIKIQNPSSLEHIFMQIDFPNGAKVQFNQSLSTNELLAVLSHVSC